MDKKLWNITLNFPWQVMRYWPLPAESLVVEESLSDEWLMTGPAPAPAQVGCQLCTFLRQFGFSSRHHWVPSQVSANHSRHPSLHCVISTNQKSESQIEDGMPLTPADISASFNRKLKLRWSVCLTYLGTGRIHSILSLCIRWCHCKWRQHLQLTRKIKPQKLEQLLSKCLNPGKVTSNREQNLTQSFRLKVFISSHSNHAVSYLECWYNKV